MNRSSPTRIAPRFARFLTIFVAGLAIASSVAAPPQVDAAGSPNVLFVTIDTLRADRLSSYGYSRPTSPNLDRLIDGGVRFTQARTVEPLTSPSLASMLTSVHPQRHGSTRNGLRVRTGLASLPKSLQARGYRTAAFVGNWTLRDKLSAFAEHFELYDEVLTRRRWLGLVRGEATAQDITDSAADWLVRHVTAETDEPFFLWVHYVEPHAPYRLHREHLEPLGIERTSDVPPADRYDTEIAFVDASIGELLRRMKSMSLGGGKTIVVFASDHGESLGEHNYWGHGRHLYEPTLRIPMSITWPGRIEPGTIHADSLIIDLAPTVLGLLDLDPPHGFEGLDWTPVLDGGPPPPDRLTRYQAHKGAVFSRHDSDLARRSGLLEVGLIERGRKEIFRVQKNRRMLFDLNSDPLELNDATKPGEDPTEGLQDWMRTVYADLTKSDETPPEPLDEESIEKLRSLGYTD